MNWKEQNISLVDESEFDSEEEGFENSDDLDESNADPSFDGIDEAVEDINFSEIVGKRSFKKALPKVTSRVKKVSEQKKIIQKKKNRVNKPLDKNITVESRAFIDGKGKRKIARILIPRKHKTIVEHVSKFILDDSFDDYKNIQYHKGNKLKQILLNIDNTNSSTDFNVELFNPSMMNDYLYSTRLNLNDRISVANSPYVSYSDLLFNILANPLYIYNLEIMFSGATQNLQRNQAFLIKNKNSQSFYNVSPVSIPMFVDNYQIENNNVNVYNFEKVINRPFIADGMDVVQYKVLAGNYVTMCFYSRQILLKKVLYPQAKHSKELI